MLFGNLFRFVFVSFRCDFQNVSSRFSTKVQTWFAFGVASAILTFRVNLEIKCELLAALLPPPALRPLPLLLLLLLLMWWDSLSTLDNSRSSIADADADADADAVVRLGLVGSAHKIERFMRWLPCNNMVWLDFVSVVDAVADAAAAALLLWQPNPELTTTGVEIVALKVDWICFLALTLQHTHTNTHTYALITFTP